LEKKGRERRGSKFIGGEVFSGAALFLGFKKEDQHSEEKKTGGKKSNGRGGIYCI